MTLCHKMSHCTLGKQPICLYVFLKANASWRRMQVMITGISQMSFHSEIWLWMAYLSVSFLPRRWSTFIQGLMFTQRTFVGIFHLHLVHVVYIQREYEGQGCRSVSPSGGKRKARAVEELRKFAVVWRKAAIVVSCAVLMVKYPQYFPSIIKCHD